MREALLVTGQVLRENEGIAKKIQAQASALASIYGCCELVSRSDSAVVGAQHRSDDEVKVFRGSNPPGVARALLSERDFALLYVRHMRPCASLFSLLLAARRLAVPVAYEIPTYPYFGEQYKASRAKHRAVAKIALDSLGAIPIHMLVDKVVCVRSRRSSLVTSKMVDVTNGLDCSDVDISSRRLLDKGPIRLVGMGAIYPYHGYDRVLYGLSQCRESFFGRPVEFHIVGLSHEIESLRVLSASLGLKRVVFHGRKSTQELNELFDGFDVGLGCLALHRRNADVDTTLKLVEYYCRGVVAVTSGEGPLGCGAPGTVTVRDDDGPIDIQGMLVACQEASRDVNREFVERCRRTFSWYRVLSQALGVGEQSADT